MWGVAPHPTMPFRVRYANSVNKLVLRQQRKFASQTPICYSLTKTFAEWVRLNFTSFWDGKPRSGYPSAPSQDTDKESSLSFRCYGLWRALGRRRRPQNDSDIGTNIVIALSFVWSNIRTHIARCKSFRPPFLKGGGSGQSPASSPTNQNLKRANHMMWRHKIPPKFFGGS